ncbi:DUF2993 domain-containing protein [Streptomyces sp. KLOTTS4A1]|uniref:LmeA family phospholipid-binding protein n=1 Tax=Streptomyces sp. KLOTTS4A1 TaxID=3390996 RepID=UPI0039F55C88
MRLRTSLITLGVLSALAIGADLAAEQVAENMAADKVTERYAANGGSVEVDIIGFPFLTQAVSGSFDEIDITVENAEAPSGPATVTIPSAHLTAHGVRIEGTTSAVAERIEGEAVVPYAAIADALQRQYPAVGDVEIAPVTGGANRVRLTRDGQHIIGRLTGQGPDLIITPETEGASPMLLTLSTGPIPVDVTGVTTTDEGVRLHIAARSLSLG